MSFGGLACLACGLGRKCGVTAGETYQAIEANFEVQDKSFSASVEIVEVNGPDIKSENSFDKSPVKPVARTAAAQSKSFRYSFPPHSYTMLRTKLV